MDRRRFLKACGALALAPAGDKLLASFDQENGVSDESKRGTVTLFFGGDVMTGRGIDQILPHPSDPVLFEDYMKSALAYVELAERVSGPIPRDVPLDYIWGDALAVLDDVRPDFRIVNLETSVTTSADPWPNKGINYRMHPRNVAVLGAFGIDCCALANNHVLDWSVAGLEETVDTLRDSGIGFAGAGRDLAEAVAPAEFDLPGGGKLRIYSAGSSDAGVRQNWAAGEDQPGVSYLGWLDPDSTRGLEDRIRAEKRPGDLAVASVHIGGNWGYEIPRDQRTFARRLIIAGADVVHGHSSHHAKGIEVYRGRPVLFGAGDLINDYEGIVNEHDVYRGELPLLFFVTLDLATGRLVRLSMQPMRIHRFRLQHATTAETGWLHEMLDREGQRFNTGVELSDGRLELRWQE